MIEICNYAKLPLLRILSKLLPLLPLHYYYYSNGKQKAGIGNYIQKKTGSASIPL